MNETDMIARKRNNEIYERIMNGEKERNLAKEYGLSVNRISNIFWRESNIRNDDLYKLCMKYTDENIRRASVIYNALLRGGIETTNDLKNSSLRKISLLKGIGVTSLGVVFKMKGELE